MKFAPMAIPAMALLQQHDTRRDILIEPAAWRRAAIEAWGHSELGCSELWAQSGCKNQPACWNKSQLQLNEICYKVCLRENFQRQSCSTLIPLSNST